MHKSGFDGTQHATGQIVLLESSASMTCVGVVASTSLGGWSYCAAYGTQQRGILEERILVPMHANDTTYLPTDNRTDDKIGDERLGSPNGS